MKKVVLVSLFSASCIFGQSLTIRETFTACNAIFAATATLKQFDPSIAHAAELLTTFIDTVSDSIQDAQIPDHKPLNALIDYLQDNKLFSTTLYLRKNPIDELEALGTYHAPDRKDHHVGQLLLSTFVNIAGNVAAITADPHNPRVVGPNIANMLAGILNVARQACKKSAPQEELNIQAYEDDFKDIVLAQALAIRVDRLT